MPGPPEEAERSRSEPNWGLREPSRPEEEEEKEARKRRRGGGGRGAEAEWRRFGTESRRDGEERGLRKEAEQEPLRFKPFRLRFALSDSKPDPPHPPPREGTGANEPGRPPEAERIRSRSRPASCQGLEGEGPPLLARPPCVPPAPPTSAPPPGGGAAAMGPAARRGRRGGSSLQPLRG